MLKALNLIEYISEYKYFALSLHCVFHSIKLRLRLKWAAQ